MLLVPIASQHPTSSTTTQAPRLRELQDSTSLTIDDIYDHPLSSTTIARARRSTTIARDLRPSNEIDDHRTSSTTIARDLRPSNEIDYHRTRPTTIARASLPTHELHPQRTRLTTIAPALSTAVAPARRTSGIAQHLLASYKATRPLQELHASQDWTTIAVALLPSHALEEDHKKGFPFISLKSDVTAKSPPSCFRL